MKTRISHAVFAAAAVVALFGLGHALTPEHGPLTVASGSLRSMDDSDDAAAAAQASADAQEANDSAQAAEEENEAAQAAATLTEVQAEQSDPQVIMNAQSSG